MNPDSFLIHPDVTYESCDRDKTVTATYLVTVRFRPGCIPIVDVEDHMSDVVECHGVKRVTVIQVQNKMAKAFRKILGF